MKRIKWFFPETTDEAVALLSKKGVVLHAGGTALIRRGTAKIKGFVDLRKAGLDYFKEEGGFIEIGAMQSYSDVVENMKKTDPGNPLVQSLSRLPMPLRNRITVGGSVASFPMWSVLMGPLMALDSLVVLAGAKGGEFKITEYAGGRELKEGTVIKAVRFRNEKQIGFFYSAGRTKFDYSAFNVTVLVKRSGDGRISDARAVVVGSREKFGRVTELESALKGKLAGEIDVNAIAGRVDIDFSAKKLGSAEYLKKLARVEIERGLSGIFKR